MKNQPIRMCFICRNTCDKKQLNRLVKNKDGDVFFDKTGKANGRGAYICNNPQCIAKLKSQKVLNKAFKCQLPQNIIEKICEELIDKQN